MADGKDAVDREQEAQKRRKAYRVANGLLSQAGIVLAISGINPRAPEMEAICRALRAVNYAGGIEKPGKEAVRAFPPRGPRFGRSAV